MLDRARRPDRRPKPSRHSADSVPSRDLEAQADTVAHHHPPSHRGPLDVDPTLPASVRAPVEQWAGTDLSDVAVRRGGPADSRLDVRAATDGDAIYVPSDVGPDVPGWLAEQVARHELAHVAQQRAASRGSAGGVLPARGGRPQFDSCFSSTKTETPVEKLRAGKTITAKEASQALDAYEAAAPADRDKLVDQFHAIGRADSAVRRLIEALTPDEQVKRMAIIRDMMDRVQAHASRAASGKTDEQLATVQGAWMESNAQAEAKAEAAAEAKKKGLPPPKAVPAAAVAKAHEKAVAKESLPPAPANRWDALGKGSPAQKAWDARAAKAIKAIIAMAAKKAPHLKLVEADIKWDPATIEGYPNRIFSLSGRPFTVGMDFIESAEADPEYVLGAVLHERYGHLEYGESNSYEWQIYDLAATKHFPSYTKPADRHSERLLYDYLGTEIYAEMREFQYSKPLSPADVKKGVTTSDAPAADIDNRVRKIRDNYEPSVGKAIVIGMYERFRADPRIIPAALALFVKAVDKYFPGALTK
jgi:hypothetical protein